MRRIAFGCATTLLAGLVLAAPALGQTTDASIIGRITDADSLALPGVTVTAASPALQVGQMTAVSDERGNYRISPLPIGTYTVSYELPGFQTVRQESVRLTAGFVASLNIEMRIGALEETIIVTAAATVDLRSTTPTTRITKELLDLLPSNRNGVLSMMALAPGLRGPLDIPANFTAVPSFKSYGREGQQWSLLEGVLTAAPSGSSGAANYWDYTTFDETQVAGIGKGVESPIRGVSFAAIVKSGGNDFHGTMGIQGTSKKFQGNNIDDELRAQGITTGGQLSRQWDLGGDLGGRIIRDKLWFYGALRKRVGANEIVGVVDPSGNSVDNTQSQHFETIKSQYQATPGLQFIGYYGGGTKGVENDALTPLTAWDVRRFYWVESHTQKLESRWVKDNIVLSLQTGAWIYQFAQDTPLEPGLTPRTLDLVTQLTTGNTGVAERKNNKEQGRYHQTGSLSWFKPDALWGDHELKVGFDYIHEYNRVIGFNRPSGNYILVFSDGVPAEFRSENAPILSRANSNLGAVYANDAWTTMDGRLTLKLGVRFDRNTLWLPEQCQEAGQFSAALCADRVERRPFNSLVPRLSFAYSFGGEAPSALKGGYGRYVLMRNAGGGQFNSPFTGGGAAIGLTRWRWHDVNGDRLYQPGEVDLNPEGADYISGTNPFTLRGSNPPDPNEGQPKEDQFYLTYERELGTDLSLRVTGLYNRVINPQRTVGVYRPYEVYTIPVTNPDPGPDGDVGTADDPGRSLTYWDYPAEYAGAEHSGLARSNPPQPRSDFKTVEASLSKRFTRGWTINSSVSATKAHEPFVEQGAGGGGEGNVRLHTPNDEINVGNFGWEWTANLAVVVQLPYGIFAATNYQGRSGDKGARTVLLRGGRQVPNVVVNAEPYGSLNLPDTHTIDVRFDKKLQLPAGHALTLKVNVFNILNANTVLEWNDRSGSNFKLPTAILPARFVDFTATYTF